MLYIPKDKKNAPQLLKEYIQKQSTAGLSLKYSGLDKNVLDEIRQNLFQLQGGLCCYCMNKLSVGNSNIEHFLPQYLFPEEQLEYSNLFLSCRLSEGKSKKEQHCDTSPGAKADNLIPKFISHPKCDGFFAFNVKGEILPNCAYKSIRNCNKNYERLNSVQKSVLATIEILNLNTKNLIAQRNSFIEGIISELQKISKSEIDSKIKESEQKNDRFKGITLYFLYTLGKNMR